MRLSDLFRKKKTCPLCGGNLEEYDRPDGLIIEVARGVKRSWKLLLAKTLGMDEDKMLDKEACAFLRCEDCERVFRS
ncbi:MAG: hypothetical protein CVV64_18080 [Candidatus Wallbacteria bacterium HGW-Wallbacteria-1]|uniref:Uncharacterized protein n=1 Tax=Candidatus Wallbacteria bacterium HGW-Wallbacteria-1 TaxID=2013854 RepID=A0A2N1PJU1_9BACT|nr:MAG: hypothetical protein CVV64_18080 [Candidatus Wallbacteria bacterium HGW-Wallbacteria-1]